MWGVASAPVGIIARHDAYAEFQEEPSARGIHASGAFYVEVRQCHIGSNGITRIYKKHILRAKVNMGSRYWDGRKNARVRTGSVGISPKGAGTGNTRSAFLCG